MIKQIETKSGFKCEIDDDVLDDMELFDAICDVERGKTIAVSIAVSKVLGSEKKRLYDFLRDENGRVPSLAVSAELTDIFTQLGKK